jgi:competence transcription factor ComK
MKVERQTCNLSCKFIGLAYQGKKDIVFRFIIEYSSARDFGP